MTDRKAIIAAITKTVDSDDDDDVVQGIHDASMCLGASCTGPGDVSDDDGYDDKNFDHIIKRLRNSLKLDPH